jgi:hypothetical protein
VDGTEYIAVQSGWGVDAARIQDGLANQRWMHRIDKTDFVDRRDLAALERGDPCYGARAAGLINNGLRSRHRPFADRA